MARLWGGASGPDYDPPRGLDSIEAREAAGAARELDRQTARRDPRAPRSRWERRYNAYERCWEDVEVEVIAPVEGDR